MYELYLHEYPLIETSMFGWRVHSLESCEPKSPMLAHQDRSKCLSQ